MKRDEAMKLVEEGIAALNDALKNGHSDTLKRFLDTMARFHHYSLNNAILIASQQPDATKVAGFQAWRKLGRCVKKGEHGIAIIAPMSRREDRDERETATDGNEVVFGFRVTYVFDVTQTEGDPLPEFSTVSGDASGWLRQLENTIRESGVTLEYSSMCFPAGVTGVSTPGAIKVSQELSEPERFSVLAHEFAHELMHHRLDRRKETTRQIREIEAEAVAYTVCRAFGIDSTTHSSDYIQLYAGTEDSLRASLAVVQQTATQIITAVRSQSASNSDSTATTLAA